ncbi:hypothetical protein TBLA_0A03250 [Henningerozyma blattae CBS 6284]|uniref:Uncharacterized protein n=1 Tax=Henningerozyma blattae (strain ATCC 34711 / CBS 6284 / DSM 70876 / NBRC 10599 / NRRL Y-10934 / UCD 77-7) TaxID=1071380 RepID=I2GVH3_HENB6|nr:hypothetical protein TBLA_0A03250 [Tetrapisispora blattae CBS 6284]CCH58125.1 hypothetical protein TBLA_0A03250 [Tetrapisispora blattae CBS 6284]
MKMLNVNDMSPILVELKRVKLNMNKTDELVNKFEKLATDKQLDQSNAKNLIAKSLKKGPSISKDNFKKQNRVHK